MITCESLSEPLVDATSVLLVYSRDCPQHDAAVLALAELLRDTFKMDVHVSHPIDSNR